ncbi:MAG: DUF4412 domain-containing protein [Flavobacteriales bacterium]|nr:hypothetical protein [Flavobacteriales bacterium]MCC6576998.1 DUF4412 domain-containing protein [Flavobacteriales bacterium]NUQ15374.1 DUF4412 domain-containing protein [Flavobacteriales bacterium]
MRTLASLPALVLVTCCLGQAPSGMPGTFALGEGITVVDDNDPFVPNSFIGSFRMETHQFRSGAEQERSPMTLRYWSSADKALTEASSPGAPAMRMLVDLKGKWQYMLMPESQGARMAMKMRKKKVVMTAQNGTADTPTVEVTNETRTIDGHRCVKVVARSSEGVWTGWVAQDLPAPFADLQRVAGTGDPRLTQRTAGVKGFPLEFEWVDANGTDRMVCKVHDLVAGTVDEARFSLDGYQVMELPGMGR